MQITQFEDKPLAHYSYAILSDQKIALVDPSRNPAPYYAFAEEHNAKIVAIFETHPHADFVSSHLQISTETGADIFVSTLVGAEYPHTPFDDGDTLHIGSVTFSAINTPGHSPDSITIHATNAHDEHAVFTGDTLFIGDVGRPDLREKAGNMKAKREDLAKAMYKTIQHKFNGLPDKTVVYPAHGAGSLCGKNMSSASSSTLGNERMGNWAFKNQTEAEFVKHLLSDPPFIPSYFGFDVDINKAGAERFETSVGAIPSLIGVSSLKKEIPIVDTRDEREFKKGHIAGSFNIMARSVDDKFETWLGSIIRPHEPFYLVIDRYEKRAHVLERVAKIGYEAQLTALITLDNLNLAAFAKFDVTMFKNNLEDYTIIDIRNTSEFESEKYFENAINLPLNTLRESIDTIPTSKPIVVHCAGGYRSAAGSSIIAKELQDCTVLDLSDHINQFK